MVSFGFQGKNPMKRQTNITNKGKFEEAISFQNASIRSVTREAGCWIGMIVADSNAICV